MLRHKRGHARCLSEQSLIIVTQKYTLITDASEIRGYLKHLKHLVIVIWSLKFYIVEVAQYSILKKWKISDLRPMYSKE